MDRATVPIGLASALALAGGLFSPPAAAAPASSPAYLPRSASLALYTREAVTPSIQLAWELDLLEQKHDALVLVAVGGGGYAISMAKVGPMLDVPMTFFYQHLLAVGLGYRSVRADGFQWGLHVVSGPLLYGARFEGPPAEHFVIGTLEGRVQAGWRAGSVTFGLTLGVCQPFDYPPKSYAGELVGGLLFGAYANWR
ncbi:MAG: hypothetical protein HYZ28_12745 [Myxococcales bacterium]|nr:hypothetical protein [Myxococcales bacterium]